MSLKRWCTDGCLNTKGKHLCIMTSYWLLILRMCTQTNRYYYQYRASRLPTCPLTIHALLHIPYYMRKTGPLWASWAFVMEWFCGHLLPTVKNHTWPYEHLDNYVQQHTQMQIVSKIYNLPSLARPFVHHTYTNGERILSHEFVYPGCE